MGTGARRCRHRNSGSRGAERRSAVQRAGFFVHPAAQWRRDAGCRGDRKPAPASARRDSPGIAAFRVLPINGKRRACGPGPRRISLAGQLPRPGGLSRHPVGGIRGNGAAGAGSDANPDDRRAPGPPAIRRRQAKAAEAGKRPGLPGRGLYLEPGGSRSRRLPREHRAAYRSRTPLCDRSDHLRTRSLCTRVPRQIPGAGAGTALHPRAGITPTGGPEQERSLPGGEYRTGGCAAGRAPRDTFAYPPQTLQAQPIPRPPQLGLRH